MSGVGPADGSQNTRGRSIRAPDTSAQNTPTQRFFDNFRSNANRAETQGKRDNRREVRQLPLAERAVGVGAQAAGGGAPAAERVAALLVIQNVGGSDEEELPMAVVEEGGGGAAAHAPVQQGGAAAEPAGNAQTGALPAQHAGLQAQAFNVATQLFTHDMAFMLPPEVVGILEGGVTTYEQVGPFIGALETAATLFDEGNGPLSAQVTVIKGEMQEAGLIGGEVEAGGAVAAHAPVQQGGAPAAPVGNAQTGALPAQHADLQTTALALAFQVSNLLDPEGTAILDAGIPTYESVGPFIEQLQNASQLIGDPISAEVTALEADLRQAGLLEA